MTDTQAPAPQLPTIALSDLPASAKDFLLALHASTGRPVSDLIVEILSSMAAQSDRPAA